MDHMNLLGDSLQKIATEKAGIIKRDIPVILGEILPATLPVFEQAALENKAPVNIASVKRSVSEYHWENNELVVAVLEQEQSGSTTYRLDLPGIYQAKNLLTVLETCSVLQQRGWNITDNNIHTALGKVKKLTGLHGRWEILKRSPLVVVDVAHNEDGIRQLTEQVLQTPHQQLHIIIGLVKDKDADSVLQLLPKKANYYFTKAQIPRALPEEELSIMAARFGLKGTNYSTVNTALYAASLQAGKKDMIIVCGSIFLAGEISLRAVRDIWGKDNFSAESLNFLEMIDFFN
jgi:dihydrofolate synthase/folylpolyglutamate synthase